MKSILIALATAAIGLVHVSAAPVKVYNNEVMDMQRRNDGINVAGIDVSATVNDVDLKRRELLEGLGLGDLLDLDDLLGGLLGDLLGDDLLGGLLGGDDDDSLLGLGDLVGNILDIVHLGDDDGLLGTVLDLVDSLIEALGLGDGLFDNWRDEVVKRSVPNAKGAKETYGQIKNNLHTLYSQAQAESGTQQGKDKMAFVSSVSKLLKNVLSSNNGVLNTGASQ
ncbi:hypothetical protein DM01DRAFT_1334701 [Hesseltinella vesiculosa]|uniref:Uncharacterized protein n=1 Tax=Hesseltinella vesiculosa TaxID=101127 RepID=A0A1X2GM16_9FUNG|nr:hypothetical protein DM01DRAFT_1334701 [Hesseltinella vesiculosa]